jgi:hypothetical protein
VDRNLQPMLKPGTASKCAHRPRGCWPTGFGVARLREVPRGTGPESLPFEIASSKGIRALRPRQRRGTTLCAFPHQSPLSSCKKPSNRRETFWTAWFRFLVHSRRTSQHPSLIMALETEMRIVVNPCRCRQQDDLATAFSHIALVG